MFQLVLRSVLSSSIIQIHYINATSSWCKQAIYVLTLILIGFAWHTIPYFFLTGEQEIKILKVKCKNDVNGCGWVGELQSLDNHLTTCRYALLRCTNNCTNNTEGVYVLRHEMGNHLTNTCPNRQYQCPHCKDIGRHCEITTTHLDTCPKLKIPCPNVGCDDSVPRFELSDHQTKCLFEKLPCRYAEIGCEEKPLRKDLQQHENDDTFHLHLAIETVHKQQKEIKTMKREQRSMKSDIANTQARPCVFTVSNFKQHKTSKQDWYSPPFYLRPGSYKMCICVDASGISGGEGTHILVSIYLMRGKNDDKLSWPFRGKVTITLLNQLKDKNHHTETLTYPEDKDDRANRKVIDAERSPVGYGMPKFISHDQLGYVARRKHQYLKDDCLFFRVTANPPWLTCTT